MLDLAFRMLLDFRDAEDVVQEAFSRLAGADITGIDDPEGWLVVVTSRLCLDRLRTRQRRPTDALDRVADPFDPHALDPSNQVTLVDNVTMAMHALLERLSPAERTSFVLHDVFQYSFEEVATVVGRSTASCRQLASRARRTLQAESAHGSVPRGLCVASGGQRAIHRGLHRRRCGGSAGLARSGRRRCAATPFPAWWWGPTTSAREYFVTSARRPPPRCCTCPSAIESASSPCTIAECWRSSC